MATKNELKTRRREDYPYMLEYRTRWNDNDMHDHMNNSVYNFLFDSVINAYLIHHCSHHPPTSQHLSLAVHSSLDFFASFAYPAVAELYLRVNKIGRSSVRYEVALFEKGVEGIKAGGEYVHAVVERETGRPSETGVPETMRVALERILQGQPFLEQSQL